MNKNWLYRILAIALVAMLALPMFAMAEEVETFDLGGEEGVELIEKKLDPPVPAVNPAMPDPKVQEWTWNFAENAGTDYSCTVDIDLANPEHYYVYTFAYEGLQGKFKAKSSKKSVADYVNGDIVIKKAGKAVLTFSGKDINGEEGRKVSLKITLNVKNTAKITLAGGSIPMYVVPANMSVGKNEDGDPIYTWAGGEQVIDDEGEYFVNFTSNKKSVVNVDRYAGTPAGEGEVTVKKTGSAKITAKLYRLQEDCYDEITLATATATVKVVPNKWTNPNLKKAKADALAYAKAKGTFVVGVESAEYIKKNDDGTGNVKFKFFVANGTKFNLPEMWHLKIDQVEAIKYPDARAMAYLQDGTTIADYPIDVDAANAPKIVSVKVSGAKKGKVGSFNGIFEGADIVDLTNKLTEVMIPYESVVTFSLFKAGEPVDYSWKKF